MTLKMNKACDLNSISVLPPHSRRSSMITAQQPRSQLSQPSFSQGISSQQNAIFSQISQNSMNEVFTENPRFGSQDKDNSMKRDSCLASFSYPRDESQIPRSMSSANLTRRWSSASVPDQKCQLSGELEHKVATMGTLLSRLGMVLDSVQSDIMQVTKGTKELSLAVEGIRQKSIAQDDFLHLLSRGQDEIKTSLEAGFRSISNQLSKFTKQEKMQETMSTVLTLLDQIEATVRDQTQELSKCFSGDLQAIMCNLKTLNQNHTPLAHLAPKVTGGDSSLKKPLFRREPEPANMSNQGCRPPKTELGGWTTIKPERGALSNHRNSYKNLKQRRFSPLARPSKVVINLDDDSDENFSCFIIEKQLENHRVDEVDEEAERILRKARRRKRRQSCKRLS
ncbi:hypothetical protein RND81_01G094500 [Saponaria officinalis]|uniref:Protein PAIR1 n=1 Tax=Saponaria officinalis TaxID=3572 RepID=A0AAW1ND29_SAPOF